MTKLNGWTMGCAVFVLCAATAIAAQAQTFTKLADFEGYDGEDPIYVSLAQGIDGNLYGAAAYGGRGGYGKCEYDYPGCGTVFRITSRGVLDAVYEFCSQTDCVDGNTPYAGVIQATDGNLYGTTSSGTVFKMSREGVLTTIYTFCTQTGCPDGAGPTASVIQASDGNFYGTTDAGGAYGYGTVFKITSGGVLTTLHSFNRADGATPLAGLAQGTNGSIYGTTIVGGDSSCDAPPVNGCGTIFKISPDGSFTTLHNFQGNDGAYPYGGLVQASDGALYGTTYGGGSGGCFEGCGTVFRITPSGKLTTIHSFTDDGCAPSGTLIQATDGNLYGTSQQEGFICPNQRGNGTVFRITRSGLLTTLHTFDGSDGASPYGGLVQGTDGNLYGTTEVGGTSEGGTVYRLSLGLGPFVSFLRNPAKVGQVFGILGQGLTGTTNVQLNGIPVDFTVVFDTLIKATVPSGATTGYVTVTTPTGILTSNVPFRVIR